MKYAIFIGCTIPVRGLNYEISARKVLSSLGIELVDIPEFTFCGFPLKSISHEASILMTARNLALAEAKGLPILTLCNACTVTMAEAKHELDHNPELIRDTLSSLGGTTGTGETDGDRPFSADDNNVEIDSCKRGSCAEKAKERKNHQ